MVPTNHGLLSPYAAPKLTCLIPNVFFFFLRKLATMRCRYDHTRKSEKRKANTHKQLLRNGVWSLRMGAQGDLLDTLPRLAHFLMMSLSLYMSTLIDSTRAFANTIQWVEVMWWRIPDFLVPVFLSFVFLASNWPFRVFNFLYSPSSPLYTGLSPHILPSSMLLVVGSGLIFSAALDERNDTPNNSQWPPNVWKLPSNIISSWVKVIT